MKNKLIYIVFFLAGLWFLTLIVSGLFSTDVVTGNVAIIPIKGVILTEGDSYLGSTAISSNLILEWIDKAENNPNIKSIIFEINSPGGTALAGKEIASRIKKINKTSIAVIRDVGASAGYLVASATDYIFADELSITGSIGAVSSYIEFSGFLEKYNLTYQRLASAKYKEMGNPFKKLSNTERELILKQLDIAHAYFVSEVFENRNVSISLLNSLEGSFFLGIQAKEYGLIDDFGNVNNAKSFLSKKLNLEVEAYEFSYKKTFFDLISNKLDGFSINIGKGFAFALLSENQLRIS